MKIVYDSNKCKDRILIVKDLRYCLLYTSCNKLIVDYHERYGHQGQKKVVLALKEHFYMNKLEKKVIRSIETCDICQKVKLANVRYEGRWINNQALRSLEQVFIDICGPFPTLSLIHI